MKHLKTYKSGDYWLIPTDKRLKQSLIDIGASKDIINSYIDYLPDEYRNNYIFVYLKTGDSEYGWKPYEGENKCWFLEQSRYEFKGNINIPNYELDTKKYNL